MGKAGNFFLKDIPCIAEVTIANFWKKEWKTGTEISEKLFWERKKAGHISKTLR
jgi:hypothetical protein